MGKDISECKFLVVADTEEETLEAIAEYIASTESEEIYTLNESAELRLPLTAGKFGIVFVLYDVNGEPLDEYYTCIFDLTTGIDEMKEQRAESKEIYDLTGRRVETVTAPGIYIVGGKKVIIR